MHSIVTTEGFVLDSKPYGEAGKLLFIFTKDYGFIVTTAQGIRLEKSKLRYFVQDYGLYNFSFVKGKEYWRLTNAQGVAGLNSEGKILKAKIGFLLKKLLHGEGDIVGLFEVIRSLFVLDDSFFSNRIDDIESLLVLRILHRLGYIGDMAELNNLVNSDEISTNILDIVSSSKVVLNKNINRAIKESHMV